MNDTSISYAELTPPPRSLAARKDEFSAWLKYAGAGAWIEYHRGCLPLDRTPGFSPFGANTRAALIAVADRARSLAEQGRLLLVQQRHGECDYSYFAIKPKRPARPLHRI